MCERGCGLQGAVGSKGPEQQLESIGRAKEHWGPLLENPKYQVEEVTCDQKGALSALQ